jgi:hypothetical protein
VTSLTTISTITANFAPVILDSVPSLVISNATTNVTLLWPAPATGFNLYSTTNLAPANWIKITNSTMIFNSTVQLSQPRTNKAAFFRLSAP